MSRTVGTSTLAGVRLASDFAKLLKAAPIFDSEDWSIYKRIIWVTSPLPQKVGIVDNNPSRIANALLINSEA